jgi:hypothetical protein
VQRIEARLTLLEPKYPHNPLQKKTGCLPNIKSEGILPRSSIPRTTMQAPY